MYQLKQWVCEVASAVCSNLLQESKETRDKGGIYEFERVESSVSARALHKKSRSILTGSIPTRFKGNSEMCFCPQGTSGGEVAGKKKVVS